MLCKHNYVPSVRNVNDKYDLCLSCGHTKPRSVNKPRGEDFERNAWMVQLAKAEAMIKHAPFKIVYDGDK